MDTSLTVTHSIAEVPADLLAIWNADVTALSQIKRHGPMVELILPLSTLTSKFVSVFVKPHHEGGWWVHDNGLVEDDAYEVGENYAAAHWQGLEIISNYEGLRVYTEPQTGQQTFYMHVTDPARLTSAVLDVGQFIQLAVNLAYLGA